MPGKTAGLFALEITLVALVGLFITMYKFMHGQLFVVEKLVITVIAVVVVFPFVP